MVSRMIRAAACGISVAFLAAAAPLPPKMVDQVPDPEALAQLDGFAEGLTRADAFSGVVLIAQGNTILAERAYGKRDAKADAPLTVNTRFNIASAGKMFTTVAILQQIAGHRVSLDTTVGRILPGFRNRTFRDTVTIRQLLTHTAGAGEIALFGADNAANRAHIRSVAGMIALRDDWAPDFTPGSKQDYSNYGYVVLGRMVEVLSGERFEDYVQHHIFAPAGMTRTGFVDCATTIPDLAVGYTTVDGEQVANCVTQPMRGWPAGGEVSTARDMFRFVRALETGTLLPLPLFAEATRVHREFMGLGFFATDYGKDTPLRDFRWGHGGSGDGVSADIRSYPRTGEVVVVLSNRAPPGAFPVAGFLHAQFTRAHPDQAPLPTR